MRICRFVDAREDRGGPTVRVGYLDGELIVPVASGDGRAGLEAVLDLAMAANADPGLRPRPDGDPVPLASARLLAPVAEPPSVRDFYAFEQHVRTARARRGREMHPDWYESRHVFMPENDLAGGLVQAVIAGCLTSYLGLVLGDAMRKAKR